MARRDASKARSRQLAWTPGGDLDTTAWVVAGRRIGAVGRCIQWLLGDWLVYGNRRFGERYARASRITGYDTQTLMNMVYVASRFATSRRREDLSWSHHETLAALSLEEQDRWLDQAAANRWSVSDLRTMLRTSRRRGRAEDGASEQRGSRSPGVAECPRCGEKIALLQ